MQNKSISYIIIANLLWSFIPIVVLDLFNEISVLMVVFLRFFCVWNYFVNYCNNSGPN